MNDDDATRTIHYDLPAGEYEIRIYGAHFERRQVITLEHAGRVTVTCRSTHMIDISPTITHENPRRSA